MGWGTSAHPTPVQEARADLAHELDVALHGHATFDGAASEARWIRLLDEVRALAVPQHHAPPSSLR